MGIITPVGRDYYTQGVPIYFINKRIKQAERSAKNLLVLGLGALGLIYNVLGSKKCF